MKFYHAKLITTIHQSSSHLQMNLQMQSFLIAGQVNQCAVNLRSISSRKVVSYEEKHQIGFTKSDKQYKFGDGAYVTAISGATIPITIATTKTNS